MRKLIQSVFLCGVMCAGLSAASQNLVSTAKEVIGIEKPNIVKVNLSSLAFKNASFQYERIMNRKMSLALGVSFMPKSGLPFASSLQDQFGDNADAKRAIETTQLSNFAITPEVRFYVGSAGAPKGFYIAPFMRYQHMNFEQVYEFTASNGNVHKPLVSGSINNIGGGVLFGAQWNLGKSVTLDWWIAGPTIGTTKGDLSGTDDMSDMDAADRADLEKDIESVELPLTKIDATVGNNRVDVKLSGPYVGIRAFGLALGFKF